MNSDAFQIFQLPNSTLPPCCESSLGSQVLSILESTATVNIERRIRDAYGIDVA